MEAFRQENVAQLASQAIGPTFPRWNEQIDYIFADYGWQVRAARAWPIEVSDHRPVTAELMWERKDPSAPARSALRRPLLSRH
jgi:endonuclease/exonuclease/phosphatase (EEP) superfamily protein YafD